ncbi:hypothetical protein [Streptomyces rimosus]|uniref:hypothetical protein n=1 Tax=Streptomyces rimosus TaxID=1927 RepID=UPI0006B25D1D|nr:hypothetical protein [Streptomyces rimosus]
MEHDFPGAADYLDLLLEPGEVRRLIGALRTAPTRPMKAKGTARLGPAAAKVHIRHDIWKVKSGKKLSPCSFARHPRWSSRTAITGCAPHTHHFTEGFVVPCRITSR